MNQNAPSCSSLKSCLILISFIRPLRSNKRFAPSVMSSWYKTTIADVSESKLGPSALKSLPKLRTKSFLVFIISRIDIRASTESVKIPWSRKGWPVWTNCINRSAGLRAGAKTWTWLTSGATFLFDEQATSEVVNAIRASPSKYLFPSSFISIVDTLELWTKI